MTSHILRAGLAAALLAGTALTPALAHDGGHGKRYSAELSAPRAAHAAGIPAREHAPSLRALMDSRPDLSIFIRALRHAGIWEHLDGDAPVIVLAPSDHAMDAEGSAFLLDGVLLSGANAGRLRDLVALHVVPGSSPLEELVAGGGISTLDGVCMPLSDHDGRLRIGPQAVIVERHFAEGGSLYVIDHLLWRHWQGDDPCGSGHRSAPPSPDRIMRRS